MTIPLFRVFSNPEIGAAVQAAFDDGFVSEGPRAARFEEEVARFLRVERERTCLVNSCTSALHIAYDLCGVRPGTSVVATPMTCLAGLLPIVHQGARIRWADIDPMTGNVLVSSANNKVEWDTVAVYGVLWGGSPLDPGMKTLGVPLVQDAAHGFGSYHGILHGNAWTCYSFQAIKTLTTGDGGCLVTPTKDMGDWARKLRWFGLDRTSKTASRWDQDIDVAGYKYHMNDVNAAIGLVQLPHVTWQVQIQRRNSEALSRWVDQECKILERCRGDTYGESSSWLYTLLSPERDKLRGFLADRGIGADIVHKRCDTYGLFDDREIAEQRAYLPGVERFDREHLCVPCGWWVETRDIEEVIGPALVEWDLYLQGVGKYMTKEKTL